MSVIVKGMEMPECCMDCKIKQYDEYEDDCVCPFSGVVCLSIGRQDACPLVALPDHHGRLVDADAFKADYGMKDDCGDCEKEMQGKVKACEYDRIYSKMDFCGWLDDAPTIVESEGENG